ncbi:MAG: AlkA N-terminal domain-containing protein [Spirochaetales bacterium]|nr:AlkA N-terminal domain-containing protein [Spirochaetales bacterium]
MIKTDLTLSCDISFDYGSILSFLTPRIIKGVEKVKNDVYMRTFRSESGAGWFSVQHKPEKSVLELQIHSRDKECIPLIQNQVRRMFDLDTNHAVLGEIFRSDSLLSRGIKEGRVPGLPVAFDPFEFVIRAVLGQQITVKAATTLAGRIAERGNILTDEDFPDSLDFLFPNPEELFSLDLEGLGITLTRQKTIRTVTEAVLTGKVKLTASQSFEQFDRDFSSLKGIGPWTVNYVAMRGLGMKDAFPASDLGIIKAFAMDGVKPKLREIEQQAETWRPWRSYAALCLWKSLSDREKM